MAINFLDMPSGGLKSFQLILRSCYGGSAVNGDLIVIPKVDELVEFVMRCEGNTLLRYALHEAAVAAKGICVMVDKIVTVFGIEHLLGDGHTNSVGDTLTERTCRSLDALGFEVLRMASGSAAKLSEPLDVLQSDVFVPG